MKQMQTTRMLALKEITENNEDESQMSDTSLKQIGAKKFDASQSNDFNHIIHPNKPKILIRPITKVSKKTLQYRNKNFS